MDSWIPMIIGPVAALLGGGLGFWFARHQASREITRLEETFSLERKNLEEKLVGFEKNLRENEVELEQQRNENSNFREANARLTGLSDHVNSELIPGLKQEREKLTTDLEEKQEELTQLKVTVSSLKTTLDEEREQNQDKLKLLEEAKEQLKDQFKNLANEIFEKNSEKFKIQSKDSLDSIIGPFKEKLAEFHNTVQVTHKEGSKERHTLELQLKNLKTLNERLSEDANNLTSALKGESKTRGIWGEMILEKVLENSGLHKGREYETQVSVRDEEGSRHLPDVIIHLPEEKDLVVDSKVSLNAWERLCSAEDEPEREKALKEHILSLRTHIKQLSVKSYEELEAIRTLDYVLMFIPIETAFLTAMEHEPGLFDEAFKKRIVIVTPSTLMVTLRTIENIWRYEQQNQNAKEIARQAGGLYDKLEGFVQSMQDVGKSIGKADSAWQKAFSQLNTGKGSLISRAQKLKELGVKTKKDLPPELVEQAEASDEMSQPVQEIQLAIPTDQEPDSTPMLEQSSEQQLQDPG